MAKVLDNEEDRNSTLADKKAQKMTRAKSGHSGRKMTVSLERTLSQKSAGGKSKKTRSISRKKSLKTKTLESKDYTIEPIDKITSPKWVDKFNRDLEEMGQLSDWQIQQRAIYRN